MQIRLFYRRRVPVKLFDLFPGMREALSELKNDYCGGSPRGNIKTVIPPRPPLTDAIPEIDTRHVPGFPLLFVVGQMVNYRKRKSVFGARIKTFY